MDFNNMTIRQINKHFRSIDDSSKWPVCGKFNATERAIRHMRKFRKDSECEGLAYALGLENEISRVVNSLV